MDSMWLAGRETSKQPSKILSFASRLSHSILPPAPCSSSDKFLMMNMQPNRKILLLWLTSYLDPRTVFTYDTHTHTQTHAYSHTHTDTHTEKHIMIFSCVWFDHAARALRRSFANVHRMLCARAVWCMEMETTTKPTGEPWEMKNNVVKRAENRLRTHDARIALALHRLKRYISRVIAP